LLWSYKAGAGIVGQPTTYLGPDGRQYLAVVAGLSGRYGMAIEQADRRDATAALGLANVFRDLAEPADPAGTLYVFRLP
jgi:hypothetical protein